MKVSILTYHWEDNYGATLQAYATQKIIRDFGHKTEFIDLRLPYHPSLSQKIIFGLKRIRFNNFRKKYFDNLSDKTYYNIQDLRNNPPLSDCYLVGSDQTWNPQIAKHLLPAFFLTFGNENIRRISYATSIGLNEWESSDYISNDDIRTALRRFKSILLREDSGIDICKNIFGMDAQQVIDPVLLFDSYHELTGDIEYKNEVVVYKLIKDSEFYSKARNLALQIMTPIRSIGSIRKPSGFKMSYPETIENWIKRIASSKLVITDSFHGTVLSILYHRPFIIYIGNPKRATRIYSLLNQLGLVDRILNKEHSIEDMKNLVNASIDWNKVDSNLQELRENSISRLRSALE